MQKYVQIYMDHFDYKTESEVMCEACGSPAVDIHHITGRGKGKDVITNLMALCRKHHEQAHSTIPKSEMQLIHNYFMQGTRKIFLK
jgi:5-methylcytosine-specific restriction endonuclease McrA